MFDRTYRSPAVHAERVATGRTDPQTFVRFISLLLDWRVASFPRAVCDGRVYNTREPTSVKN